MRHNLFTLGHKFTIENEAGQDVYQVEGPFFLPGNSLALRDMDGNEPHPFALRSSVGRRAGDRESRKEDSGGGRRDLDNPQNKRASRRGYPTDALVLITKI